MRSAAIRAAEIDLAWKIAMSQRGQTETKAKHPFVLAAAAAVREQIRAIFDDAVVRALRKIGATT